MLDILIYILGAIYIYFASGFLSYHIALILFKWLMPLKNKHGHTRTFKILAAIPFTFGFLLDIFWNVAHFSRKLYFMNRKDHIHHHMKFWPYFARVEGLGTLYRITLTERLQLILDTYPRFTHAWAYAENMREVLNKYDPDHLTIK